ncbi:YiiX/YebB-like N1pC/P60 family cysteine hydrolase [Ferruginibacter paludis]|uniref:YiiX/YebB-like N1pC/P60 family cysteine hydrolase n=1 Tax=Ferruginibacter paludis TaxID=1310417 RepID=UPI0025B38285|nr:YiiX/YebB-like N1pC/P60 family cysteine hydrolase [Ferruginibacter paludis]MDN3654803.1 YiiX/YebB-like N1pC/P60 family cysteine hydrolase [Ferruginibacter paludis]
MSKIKKRLLYFLGVVALAYFLMLIPDSDKAGGNAAASKAFTWNKDLLWSQLEDNFRAAKLENKSKVDSNIQALFLSGEELVDKIKLPGIAAADTNFTLLLNNFFSLAPLIAAQPQQRDSFIRLYSKIRREVKLQSQHWDINDVVVRNSLYQLLYGMRAAEEEVLLQTASVPFDAAINVTDVVSATPAAKLFGITVHSGDLLVSRGGAEVSALISRGNDYPANFSHVALIYVNEKEDAFLIEAHIEKGVAVSSLAQYIKDKKLRCMVLRPRADLRQLQEDKMVPQKAAKLAYDEALSRHIPYDFKMNFYDSTAMFCSEVASYAYRKNGIYLWQGVSTISSPGVVDWLNAFGVENFVTQMPGDLEYDPQLGVVAEYRDPETLLKDHIDNAVMDVLLEQADKGKQIKYNHWQLPFVRIVKGWCMAKNYFRKPGIIPEGMSATRALKNQYFVAMYQALKTKAVAKIDQFKKDNHYLPPYWQMINLAREAAAEQ